MLKVNQNLKARLSCLLILRQLYMWYAEVYSEPCQTASWGVLWNLKRFWIRLWCMCHLCVTLTFKPIRAYFRNLGQRSIFARKDTFYEKRALFLKNRPHKFHPPTAPSRELSILTLLYYQCKSRSFHLNLHWFEKLLTFIYIYICV